MERKFSFAVDEFYHLYNRGADKRDIFLDQADRERFLVLLHVANSQTPIHISNLLPKKRSPGDYLKLLGLPLDSKERLVDIGLYCLMNNHFHLAVRERRENGISQFMLKLLTGYSMYFNKKHDHSGTLFQGEFKAKLADSDEYLRYLFAYIHLNPLKLRFGEWKGKGLNKIVAKKFLDNYPYSSYQEYNLGTKRLESVILNPVQFPKYFSTPKESLDELFDWLESSEDSP